MLLTPCRALTLLLVLSGVTALPAHALTAPAAAGDPADQPGGGLSLPAGSLAGAALRVPGAVTGDAPRTDSTEEALATLRAELTALKNDAPAWAAATERQLADRLDRVASRLDQLAARADLPLPQAHEPVLLVTVAAIALAAGFLAGRVSQNLRRTERRPHL